MKRKIKLIWDATIILAFKQIARGIAYLWPRDKNLIAVGAWMGKTYGDSPKYLVEYLLENSDFRIVWVGNEAVRGKLPDNPRLGFARKGSVAATIALLRAGTWVCCISIEWDLTSWPIEGNALLINTVHGYSLKKGGEEAGRGKKASFCGALARRLSLHRKPYGLVGSEKDVRKLLRYDADYFSFDKMLRIGSPTVSWLICNKSNTELIEKLKCKYAMLCGFKPGVKIITYLPTWRSNGGKVFSFYSLDADEQRKWKSMLDRYNAVIVEKHHSRTLERYPYVENSICSFPISAEKQSAVDVHELMLATDILVSDYSSTGPDFGVLGRPCLNFMYDLEAYIRECGLVDGWREMIPGPILSTTEELFDAVEKNLLLPEFLPASGYIKTCEYQSGKTCKQLMDFIKENNHET